MRMAALGCVLGRLDRIFVTALLSVALSCSASVDNTIVRETDAFRLHVHFDAPQLADEAADVLDATWRVASRLYDSDLPDARMDVHLYRDVAGYERAEAELTQGKFRRNLAFAHWGTTSAHVALQPRLADASIPVTGLPKETARLLAHEAAHLVGYAAMENFRSHPHWIAEGIPSWVEFEVLLATGRAESHDDDPRACSTTRAVRRMLDNGTLPSVADIVAGRDTHLGFYDRYRVHWFFVATLIEQHRSSFVDLLVSLRQIREHPKGVGSLAEWLDEMFGAQNERLNDSEWFEQVFGSQTKRLDKSVMRRATKLDPRWRQERGSLETGGDVWTQVPWPGKNAMSWSTDTIDGDFIFEASVTIRPAETTEAFVRFGRSRDFWQVSLMADYGLAVYRFDGTWNHQASVRLDKFVANQSVAMRLRHDAAGEALKISLDGEVVHTHELSFADGAQWGLGAQSGSLVDWSDVRVRGAVSR